MVTPKLSPKKLAKKAPPVLPAKLRLDYDLDDLPSTQHRAGVAGLLLLLQWRERFADRRGLCRVVEQTATTLSIELDVDGLGDLLDRVYSASQEELSVAKPWKDETAEDGIKAPLRIEEVTVKDKKGAEKLEKRYIYPTVVPLGAFLDELDRSPGKLWVKLWRDAIYGVLKGVATTKYPYQARAAGLPAMNAAKEYAALCGTKPIGLASADFIGVQAKTSEGQLFLNTPKHHFLSHFWAFVTSIYVPRVVVKGELRFEGYVFAIPDVVDLNRFGPRWENAMRSRAGEATGHRPRASIVDALPESGLDMVSLLEAVLPAEEGARLPTAPICGVDLVWAAKEGNNVRTYGVTRVDPTRSMIDLYACVRAQCWSANFRRIRMANLVADRPWWTGFNRMNIPFGDTLADHDTRFAHDARESLKTQGGALTPTTTPTDDAPEEAVPDTIEGICYMVARNYVLAKLDTKYNLVWNKCQGVEARETEFRKMKHKVARQAFLEIRSKSSAAFQAYVAKTLCSQPQRLGEARYGIFAKALREQPDEVHTFMLLALSANS